LKRGDWVRFDGHLVKIIELVGGGALIEFRNGARLRIENAARWLSVTDLSG
jgi:hypothetical protein